MRGLGHNPPVCAIAQPPLTRPDPSVAARHLPTLWGVTLYTRGPLGPRVGAIRQRAKTQSISFNNSSAVVPNSAAKAIKMAGTVANNIKMPPFLRPVYHAPGGCATNYRATLCLHTHKNTKSPLPFRARGLFGGYSSYSAVYFSFR